jgi:hypothetical protein
MPLDVFNLVQNMSMLLAQLLAVAFKLAKESLAVEIVLK